MVFKLGAQEFKCKACEGEGLLRDDEYWQYTCPICDGDGFVSEVESKESRISDVDQNHRILD